MTAPANSDVPTQEAASPLGRLNQLTRRRQRMLLAGGTGVAALAGLWFAFGSGGTPTKTSEPASIETDGIMNRPLSEREFVATYGNRLDDQARQLKALADRRNTADPQLQAKLDALAAENQAMKSNGTATIDALTRENATLRDAVTQAQAAQPPVPVVRDPSMPSGSPLSPNLAPDGAANVTGMPATREVKTLSFTLPLDAAAARYHPRQRHLELCARPVRARERGRGGCGGIVRPSPGALTVRRLALRAALAAAILTSGAVIGLAAGQDQKAAHDDGKALGHPSLLTLAREQDATPAQVALAWLLAREGVIAIPKAGTLEHVRENRDAADLQLSQGDLRRLDQLFPPPRDPVPLEML